MSGGIEISPTQDRDLLLAALVAAVAAVLALVGGLLVVATVLGAVLAGGPLEWPPAQQWPQIVLAVLSHAGDPGASVGDPWAAALAGRPAHYWATAGALLAVTAAASGIGIARGWQQWGPTPPGHATRREIRRELSLAAARRTAAWTRPGLSPQQRRRAPLPEVGAPLHHGPIGPMCTPLENPTGSLAPTQSGKSRNDLVHKTLAAPGALLCSTTKPDLLEFAGLARSRRHMAGPVLVYDTTGSVPWPAQVIWSPITGCADLQTAYRRAHTMVEASAVSLTNVTGNDKVFRERAVFVLAAYLHAAAIHRHGMDALLRWATSKPPSDEPVQLLKDHAPDLAFNLAAEIGMVAETSDAVWLSVRRVLEPLLDPRLLHLCSPADGTGFDARQHIADQGSLFLVAGQHQAIQAVPLLTALAEHWLTTAQEMALDYPSRRVDPPATAVLDEVCNATPVPQLPDIASDSAGRGLIIHWAAQSLAQLEETFGPARARQLVDNTTTLTSWGGLKDSRALEWLSTLSGHHDRLRWQQHSDGLLSPGRASYGAETVPTYRPGDVRGIERGKVLVLHRTLRPILARTVDVSRRPDWNELRADVAAVRAGIAPVNSAGFRIDQPPPTTDSTALTDPVESSDPASRG